MISGDLLFNKSPNIVARRVMDEVLLVPVEGDVLSTQCIYSTNDVGGSVWELIDGNRSVADIAAALVRDYEVDEPTALRDVAELLETLLEKGCILGPL